MEDHVYSFMEEVDPAAEALESDYNIMTGGGLENEWARREAEEELRHEAYCAEQEYREALEAGLIEFGPPEPFEIPF